MPVILRLFGFSFYFFSREHEPIHVHIEGADGYAVYDLTKDRFVQRTGGRSEKDRDGIG